MQVDPAAITALTSGKYEKPRTNWPITKYARRAFIGPADALAATDQQYPMLRWNARIKELVKVESGAYEISFEETMTIICGDGVQFRQERFEVWGPENDPTA